MKKLLLAIVFIINLTAQDFKFGEAKGLFMCMAIGPRVPVGNSAILQNVGIGFDVSVSYTDNVFAPVFLYSKLGYNHFPGRQSFYKNSDYSAYSNNNINLGAGIRVFLPPIFENVLLVMPIIETGAALNFCEKLHQFKIDTAKNPFYENSTKLGFQFGAGISTFLLDVIGYYNYYDNDEYLSFDMRIRIPIYITF